MADGTIIVKRNLNSIWMRAFYQLFIESRGSLKLAQCSKPNISTSLGPSQTLRLIEEKGSDNYYIIIIKKLFVNYYILKNI